MKKTDEAQRVKEKKSSHLEKIKMEIKMTHMNTEITPKSSNRMNRNMSHEKLEDENIGVPIRKNEDSDRNGQVAV